MYKIGIDARLYSQTGVGVYLRNLLYFLEKIAEGKILFYIYLLPEDYDKVKFTNRYFIKKLIGSRWHTFSEQIQLAWALYKDNLDLVHFTYFSYPIFYRKKFIATVHDTTPLTFKTGKASTKNRLLYEFKFRAFRFVIYQQVKNAAYVITPSKTVKKQLVEFYGKSIRQLPGKIVPIYEGVDYQLRDMARRHSGEVRCPSDRLQNRFWTSQNDTRDFFIYVGNFYPHKNVERLVRAFAQVRGDVRLVLIGPDDFFSMRLIQLIDRLNQQERIVFFHNPSKADLVFFYKNALALIHPSLSEGFGLPLVEAAYFRCPILASDIDAFQEIFDGRYIVFDPKNVDDIRDKIADFLNKKPEFNYVEILNKISFKKMAKETYNLYQRILMMPTVDRR